MVTVIKSMTISPDMGTLLELMRILTYLKIICTGNSRYLQRYKDAIQEECLLEVFIENYLTSKQLRSSIYTIEFLGFLGNQLTDFPTLYFKALCGVNLDPVLEVTIAVDSKDANLLLAYARFLDNLTQCLKHQEASQSEIQLKLIKIDTDKVMKTIDTQLENLIDGLEVYKNAYETIATQLCSTALQIIHEHLATIDNRALMSSLL